MTSSRTHTHWVCFPALEKWTGKEPLDCCGCSDHDCDNATTEMDRRIGIWRDAIREGKTNEDASMEAIFAPDEETT